MDVADQPCPFGAVFDDPDLLVRASAAATIALARPMAADRSAHALRMASGFAWFASSPKKVARLRSSRLA